MPKKHLGQHFLSDPRILERIARFADFVPEDTVIEIGPGKGSLTKVLARKARHVIAIEIDPALALTLGDTMPGNVEILERDALDVDFTSIASGRYHLVANLPYNIATPLIGKFVLARSAIIAATVMVQKEVADRISASPGSRRYGSLSIGVQYYAFVERGPRVPPGAFVPKPKVHSQMIRMTWRSDVPDFPELMAFVRKSFSSRRKKLVNNISPMFPDLTRDALQGILDQEGLDPGVRPEDLSVQQFVEIHRSLTDGRAGASARGSRKTKRSR